MKTGLILEGGAMRGMFTAGVLDVLMEQGIAFVVAVGGVVADGPPDLVGFVVAAEHCSRRNTYHAVYRDALLHQNIQNTVC